MAASVGSTEPDHTPVTSIETSAAAQDQQPASAAEPASGKDGKTKTVNGTKGQPKAADAANDEKLSGKELKERKKAEKEARRAQDKQKQHGQPVVDLQGGNKGEVKKDGKPGGATNAPAPHIGPPGKGQHKRTGSTNQKSLPIRAAESQIAPVPEEPKQEEKRVALFDHLYGHPRRTTLAGAGKDVHPAVLALGLQMSNYVICGSTARCVATLLVFKQVIDSYTTPAHTSLTRHLTTHISSQIDYLVSCRPISTSMGNAIRWLKVEISEIDVSTPEADAKADLCLAIDNFIRERITVAGEVIAASAAGLIKDGDVIMTYAKSSVVQSTLAAAFHQGKTFKVVVVDSRPLFEGKNLARGLASLGIEVQYTLTHGIDRAIKPVTKVFLGAHAMLSNGRLYSRIGTALVAMAAKEHDIPTLVCSESVKFTDRVALDSFVHNEIAPPDELLPRGQEGAATTTTTTTTTTPLEKWQQVPNLQLLNLMYDVTPAEYIHMVVTEYGSLPPSSIPVVHRLSTNT